VVRDVLDLVGDRPAVDLAQPREDVRQRLALDVDAEDRGGDLLLELGRQRNGELRLLERRVPERLRTERVEAGREVAVGADRVDERHRRRNGLEQLGVADGARDDLFHGLGRRRRRLGRGFGLGRGFTLGGRRGRRHLRGRRRSRCRRRFWSRCKRSGRRPVPVAVRSRRRESPETGERGRENGFVGVLEELAPRRIDRLRILEVLLEQLGDVPRVQADELRSRSHDLVDRRIRDDRDDHPEEEGEAAGEHGGRGERAVGVRHADGDERDEERRRSEKARSLDERDARERERESAEEAGNRVRALLLRRGRDCVHAETRRRTRGAGRP
jgi:hypothetical protein